ncbi:MAG: RimK family protein [Planctomycetes bacterium]|jgi:glutathione synthase/RimK-type ligase-like ATP-grasp enzyme|nr:RimK family protein [Planctomycetota bacterium]
MRNLVVVNDPKEWSFSQDGVEIVAARKYLTHPSYTTLEKVRLINLCRSLGYQKIGYYVSLLADARGHKPMPSIETIQNMKDRAIAVIAGSDLQEIIDESLSKVHSAEYVLSVYFGRNMAQRHERLANALFRMFPSPYLQATFVKSEKTQRWRLEGLKPMAIDDIPAGHAHFAEEATTDFLQKAYTRPQKRAQRPYDLAILVDPEMPEPPSNKKALQKFQKAGEDVGFNVEFIQQEDYPRIGEFDALFIRETTSVNHHTFRFACRAEALGLVVMDDPASILRCSNKVFLAEMADQQDILVPNTMIVHRGNVDDLVSRLGLPCVLKQPDSSFSAGVKKVSTPEELNTQVEAMLEKSDLVIAQGFVPTEFDWRIGVLDGQPLFACRYYMADNHWQILKRDAGGKKEDVGRAETIPVEMAPTKVVKTALKAANHVGKGLYGVDLKEVGGKVYMIEVNDNPNIDAGFEDEVIGDDLYLRIMRTFFARVTARHRGWGSA